MATPKTVKNILRSAAMRNVLCWAVATYLRLVWRTGRWVVVNDAVPEQLNRDGRSAIICFWHGRLLMMPFAWRWQQAFFMLISQHADGQMISQTVGHFGFQTIAGSTSRGGSNALREMVRTLNRGDFVGVTPDGPRGPRMRASSGLINMARLTGAPLLPLGYSSRRGKRLSSWDRFLIAYPFSGGALVWGELLEVPKDLDEAGVEAARVELENRLNAVTAEADRLCGQTPTEPAAVVEGTPL